MPLDNTNDLQATLRQKRDTAGGLNESRVRTIKLKNTIRAHDDAVASIRCHPSRNVVASSGDDGLLKLWAIPRSALSSHACFGVQPQ